MLPQPLTLPLPLHEPSPRGGVCTQSLESDAFVTHRASWQTLSESGSVPRSKCKSSWELKTQRLQSGLLCLSACGWRKLGTLRWQRLDFQPLEEELYVLSPSRLCGLDKLLNPTELPAFHHQMEDSHAGLPCVAGKHKIRREMLYGVFLACGLSPKQLLRDEATDPLDSALTPSASRPLPFHAPVLTLLFLLQAHSFPFRRWSSWLGPFIL